MRILPTAVLFFLMAAHPAAAQQMQVAVPSSAWLVGPASPLAQVQPPAEGAPRIPCIMANEFDNGYEFRFSGGGGKILALAVDFRRHAFEPGQSYGLSLMFPSAAYGRIFPAQAFNATTLLVNTQEEEDFYKALSAARTLQAGIGDETTEFVLAGIGDGIRRMEECYGGGASVGMKSAMQNPLPMESETKPEAEREPGKFAPLSAEQAEALIPMPMSMPMPIPDADAPVQENNAALDMVLEKAARKIDGMKSARPQQGAPPAADDGMLARTWSSPWNNGEREATSAGGKADERSPGKDWQAAKSAGLRETLDNWARAAGGEMVWAAGEDFPVRDAMAIRGRFEDAVLTLLSQYDDLGERPVGKIYNDPGMGKKILLIERDKAD